MKRRVSKLLGIELDAAVVHAENIAKWQKAGCYWVGEPRPRKDFHPSSNWADGGPIIERERILFDDPADLDEDGEWYAYVSGRRLEVAEMGQTMLVAAMRVYVSSIYGDSIELEFS